MIVSALVTRALRRAGVIDAFRTPTDEEMVDGLDTYNVLVSGLIGSEIGQKCTPYAMTGASTGQIGRIYQNRTGSTLAVTVPQDARAGDRFGASAVTAAVTVVASGTRIGGQASNASISNGDSQVWWFDDENADWIPEADAEQSDTVPFSADISEALTDLLSWQLANEYGPELVTEPLTAKAQQARQTIAARYGSKARNRVV